MMSPEVICYQTVSECPQLGVSCGLGLGTRALRQRFEPSRRIKQVNADNFAALPRRARGLLNGFSREAAATHRPTCRIFHFLSLLIYRRHRFPHVDGGLTQRRGGYLASEFERPPLELGASELRFMRKWRGRQQSWIT